MCVLPCSFGFQESHTGTRVCCLLTFASSSAHAVPHAVSGPDCAALLPAVVALAVALLTVLLLLVAAVFTAILFYTSESIIIVLTVYDSVSARPSTQGCALVQAELHNSKLGLMPI